MKPLSDRESGYYSEYKWGKKYYCKNDKTKIWLGFCKKQIARCRRRSIKQMIKEEFQNESLYQSY
jgi:hypothetical protein